MNDIPGSAGVDDAIGDDEIVAEVRAARDVIFARAGYEIQELGKQLRARQAAAGREGVTLSPKPPECDSHAADTRVAPRARSRLRRLRHIANAKQR